MAYREDPELAGSAIKISGQNLTIANSAFRLNTVADASLIVADSNITIYNTVFEQNTQSTAGGLSLTNSEVLLVDVNFLQNTGVPCASSLCSLAGSQCTSLCLHGDTLPIKTLHSALSSESSFERAYLTALRCTGGQAGAVSVTGNSSLAVTYSTFTSNTGSQGGAIGLGENCQLQVLESSFHSNSAENGGAIYALQCALPSLARNILEGMSLPAEQQLPPAAAGQAQAKFCAGNAGILADIWRLPSLCFQALFVTAAHHHQGLAFGCLLWSQRRLMEQLRKQDEPVGPVTACYLA